MLQSTIPRQPRESMYKIIFDATPASWCDCNADVLKRAAADVKAASDRCVSTGFKDEALIFKMSEMERRQCEIRENAICRCFTYVNARARAASEVARVMPGSENTTEFDIIFNAIYDVNFFAGVTRHCMSTDGVIKHLIIEATEGYACTVGQAFHEKIEINTKMQWKKKSWKSLLKAEKAAAAALATAAAAFTATKDAEGARDALKAAVEAFTTASTAAAHATEDFATMKKAVRAEMVKERRLRAQDPRPLPLP